MTVARTGGNDDIERSPVGQGDTLPTPVHGVEKVHLETIAPVLAAQTGSPPTGARKESGKNIVGVAEIGKTLSVLVTLRTGSRLCIFAIVTALRRLRSGCVDFTAIEPRSLLLVADDVVSGGKFLKLALRVLVPRIEVGMIRLASRR